MPAIGDQVASLELDHANALASIDSLTAANAALTSANTSLTADNAALQKYADEIKAMVDSVATSALNMLKASRLPIVAAVTAIVDDVKSEGQKLLDLVGGQAAVVAAPVASLAGDSGDEQPLAPAAPVPQPNPAPVVATPLPDAAPMWVNRVPGIIAADAAAIETRIAEIPAAVERMLHHSSAASTVIRRPVDMTMHVDHTSEGLPMFLRKGTAFDALARRDYLR